MTIRGPAPTAAATHGSAPSAAADRNNVIAVASGKGGVGKTWLAISLCHALARRARRVLLFDGDLGLANVDVQLGLMPRFDLSSVLAGRRPLEGAVTAFQDGNFDIVAGQSGAGTLAALAPKHLAALRDGVFRMAPGYDHVIMDIGAGIDRTVQTLIQGVGTAVVVTTDEPTALTDAYAFIKVMTRAGHGAGIRIVVNVANDHGHGNHTYQALLRACESFLGIAPPLAGVVRRDPHVAQAIRRQSALLTRHPNCDAAADVAAIAERFGTAP